MFTLGGKNDVEERMREFFSIVSSGLLNLGEKSERSRKNRHAKGPSNLESVYILLDVIVNECDFLSMDLLESCFPYNLIRKSYHVLYKEEKTEDEEQ